MLSATPIGRKLILYVEEGKYKLQQEKENLQAEYNKIPIENRTELTPRIAFQIANEFNYCLDEPDIKEAFINLLVADMDSRKKDKVLPGYIDVIKQLSSDDAKFLKLLKDKSRLYGENFSVIQAWCAYPNNVFSTISHNILVFNVIDSKQIDPIVLDNLIRLRLVEIPVGRNIKDENKNVKRIFELFKETKTFDPIPDGAKLVYEEKTLSLTAFGKGFLEICL